MTKIGLISDIHGDPIALELAWAHLTTMGVDRILCAGDLVGYGPKPNEVVAFLKKHQIPSVRGNHDRWGVERPPLAPDPFKGGSLSVETRNELASLPFDIALEIEGRFIVVVHASPFDDLEFINPKTHPGSKLREFLRLVDADVLIHGHTHQPMIFQCDEGLVINPGSVVSMPVVSTSRTFAVLNLEEMTATCHDVESGQLVSVPPWPDDLVRLG